MSKTPLLQVQEITAQYRRISALHGVSLDVFEGEVVSLLGGNGAGKSTTLMCISGIHTLKSGAVFFAGRDIKGLAPHERVKLGLAQVPEGRRIFPRLTVYENIQLGGYLIHDAARKKETEDFIFSLFPVLEERKTQLGGTLSGGEQQMLAIGRALMSQPKMLLLDEPSMGIAPLLVKKIFEALAELQKKGMTILLIEQNAHLALKLASRAYVLETGRITLSGQASDLAKDPRVQDAYLAG